MADKSGQDESREGEESRETVKSYVLWNMIDNIFKDANHTITLRYSAHLTHFYPCYTAYTVYIGHSSDNMIEISDMLYMMYNAESGSLQVKCSFDDGKMLCSAIITGYNRCSLGADVSGCNAVFIRDYVENISAKYAKSVGLFSLLDMCYRRRALLSC